MEMLISGTQWSQAKGFRGAADKNGREYIDIFLVGCL
jgi:hypothetical protein